MGDDCWEGVLDSYGRSVVLGPDAPDEGSRVCLVAEHAVNRGLDPLLAARALDAFAVERPGYLQGAAAVEGHVEDATDLCVCREVELELGAFLGAILDVDLLVAVGRVGVHPETARGSRSKTRPRSR